MIFGSPTFMGCVTAESFGHAQTYSRLESEYFGAAQIMINN